MRCNGFKKSSVSSPLLYYLIPEKGVGEKGRRVKGGGGGNGLMEMKF